MSNSPKDDRPKPVDAKGEETPEVFGIVKDAGGFRLTRRGLWGALGAGAAAAAAATGSTACAHSKRTKRVRQMGPKTWTQPCGTPIPPGATCICDCIATNASFQSSTEQVCICDTIEVPAGQAMTGGSICTCDLVCTCDTIGGMGSGGGGNTWGGGGHYWHPT